MNLAELLVQMQDDMPRVQAEARRKKKLPHHKMGLNRCHNEDTSWMPAQWVIPTQGTRCGGFPRLYEEPGDGE